MLRLIIFYILVFFAITACFIGLLHSGLLVYIPLFYKGIVFLVLSALIICLGALFLGALRRFSSETIVASLVLALAINFGFFVIIPVTIDRSVTTFMLSGMNTRSEPFSKPDLRSMLVEQFIDEFDAVGRRLQEQILSGNVATDGMGGYYLTNQGKGFLRFAQTVAKVYSIPQRYVSGKNR